MKDIIDVIVIGQGVVGLSAGIAMQNLGFTVTVVGANPLPNSQKTAISRVYAINLASIQLLQNIHVWQHIAKNDISSYDKMYVWEAQGGATLEFDARINASSELGVILAETTLKTALYKQAKAQNLQLINSFTVTEVCEEEDYIKIANTEQTCLTAKLLIIADGARSNLRDKLGVKITTWSYNQTALITNVQTSKPHNKTAYQVFTKDGPLAFLPQADPMHCSIVWSLPPDKAQNLAITPEAEFNKNLANTFANKLGEVSLLAPRYQFPLHMRHTKQYNGKRWILIGDAAHTIHPLAGLGLNVGLADLTTWLSIVKEHNNAITSNKVLSTYQRKRKHALWQIIALMQALHLIFTNKITPLAHLTSIGLNLVNNLTPIKKLIIQHASGVEGHLI